MNIGDIHKFSIKSMKKQSNIDIIVNHFLILFWYQLTSIETI